MVEFSIIVVVLIAGALVFNSLVHIYRKKDGKSKGKKQVDFLIYTGVVIILGMSIFYIFQTFQETNKSLAEEKKKSEQLELDKNRLEIEKTQYKDSLKTAYHTISTNLDSLEKLNRRYLSLTKRIDNLKKERQAEDTDKIKQLEDQLKDFMFIIKDYEVALEAEDKKMRTLYAAINERKMADLEIQKQYYDEQQRYHDLKKNYDKQKYIIKGLDALIKGKDAKGEDRKQFFTVAMFYFRKGHMSVSDENYKFVQNELKK